MNERTAAETPVSCKDRVVTAATGIGLFAGLINLAAISVLTCPRNSARSGRSWPKPLGTGKPEDGVWSGHRHWLPGKPLPQEDDQQNTRLEQHH